MNPQASSAAQDLDFSVLGVDLAQSYRRRIDFQNVATPQEAADLAAGVTPCSPEDRQWAVEMMNLAPLGDRLPEPFVRERLCENVMIFRGNSGPQPQPRRLLVGFCGNALRLMIPTPTFLQRIRARDFDVMLLRTHLRGYYLDGVPGYSTDLPSTCRNIMRDADIGQYASVHCLGTSMGGVPTLLAAHMLGACVGLSVGGGMGQTGELETSIRAAGLHDPRPLRTGEAPPLRLFNLYSGANERDTVSNQLLCGYMPDVTPLAISGIKDHNTLYQLLLIKRLKPVLDLYLLAHTFAPGAGAGTDQ
jgi:hypothetical protein